MPSRHWWRGSWWVLGRPTRCGVSGSRGVGGRSAPDADRIPVPHRRSGLRPRRLLIRRLIRNAVAEDPARGVGGVAPTYEVRGVWVAGRRGRSPDLHAFCVVLAEELARVEHAAVLPDFEMHVGAGGAAGRAGLEIGREH